MEAEAPYLRIAADIRQRIIDGDLAAGDRVPSTRQISKEWGVALATATKALAVLRQAGLVIAKPRAGTVVAPRQRDASHPSSRPPHRREQELTQERIVRVAIEIADSEGLAALSIRRIAACLGVAAMSPYRYVPSKDDLILLMVDTVCAEVGYPDEPPADWPARLELWARTVWGVYRQHPWLAQVNPPTRPLPLPSLVVHGEWALAALDGLGLDPRTMRDVLVLVYSYVQGLAANLRHEVQAAAIRPSAEGWTDTRRPDLQAIAASGRYPTFTKVAQSLARDGDKLELDELFEFGLRPLIDGIAELVRKFGSTKAKR